MEENVPRSGTYCAYYLKIATDVDFEFYQATQKITSNQVINSGYTVYKAEEVELDNNFEIKLGAAFDIIIDNNGCQ